MTPVEVQEASELLRTLGEIEAVLKEADTAHYGVIHCRPQKSPYEPIKVGLSREQLRKSLELLKIETVSRLRLLGVEL